MVRFEPMIIPGFKVVTSTWSLIFTSEDVDYCLLLMIKAQPILYDSKISSR